MNNEYGPFVLLWFHGLGLWAFFLSLNIYYCFGVFFFFFFFFGSHKGMIKKI